MAKLFDENLGVVTNSKQLKILKSKFSDYDPIYVAVSTMNNRPELRGWLENLWRQYKQYADSNFRNEFKKQFNQRAWELYLGVTLLNRGYHLGDHSNKGPDFKIPVGRSNIWMEAISVRKGDREDRVPEMEFNGKAIDVPEGEMLLRLSAGLMKKYNKYLSYRKSSIINSSEPFVIAIDRSGLEHTDPQIPLILKCLFGIGYQVLSINSGKPFSQTEGSAWSLREKVTKVSGSEVPQLLFRDSTFEGISLVVYCNNNILNCPREPEKMGDNFVMIHNPFAKNPLPENFFKFGQEWKQEGKQLMKIRDP